MIVDLVSVAHKKSVSFFQNEQGATAIEYGVIAALISLAAIGTMRTMGGSFNNIFVYTGTKIR